MKKKILVSISILSLFSLLTGGQVELKNVEYLHEEDYF